ncbi:hypothetical protein D6D19_01471, partial [Aureobasidium pullulans]
ICLLSRTTDESLAIYRTWKVALSRAGTRIKDHCTLPRYGADIGPPPLKTLQTPNQRPSLADEASHHMCPTRNHLPPLLRSLGGRHQLWLGSWKILLCHNLVALGHREYSRKSVYGSGENQSTVYSTQLRRTSLRDIATKCGDTTVSRGHRVICVATKASRRRCCGNLQGVATILLAPALCSLPLYTIFFVTLSAATFPLSGRQGDALGVVVGNLTKKSYVQQRLSNTWTRPKY